MILQLPPLRIVFFGSRYFAGYHLYILLCCSIHKVCAIFTQETQLFNKKSISFIEKIAKTHNITLFNSRNLLQSNIANLIRKLNADIIVVISYGSILSQEILNIPKLGCINIHGSLLPRWRGAAPIQRAIEFGDSITGISIIKMDSKIDTGKILCYKTCKILPTDTSDTLSKKLAKIGSVALLQTIDKITIGTCRSISQNSLYATYAYKIKKIEARIDWKNSATTLERRIRAFNPWPICYFHIQKKQIKIWNARISNHNINDFRVSTTTLPGTILKTTPLGIYVATGSKILVLTELQIQGKKKTTVKDILNAYKTWFTPNTTLK